MDARELVRAIPPAETLRDRLNELRAEAAALRKLYRVAEARDTILRRAGLADSQEARRDA